jgi:hypothetical protein
MRAFYVGRRSGDSLLAILPGGGLRIKISTYKDIFM